MATEPRKKIFMGDQIKLRIKTFLKAKDVDYVNEVQFNGGYDEVGRKKNVYILICCLGQVPVVGQRVFSTSSAGHNTFFPPTRRLILRVCTCTNTITLPKKLSQNWLDRQYGV